MTPSCKLQILTAIDYGLVETAVCIGIYTYCVYKNLIAFWIYPLFTLEGFGIGI